MGESMDVPLVIGDESSEITFPAGLVGFDEWIHFTVVSHELGGPLQLLQSKDDYRVSFITTDPVNIVSDYKVTLTKEDARELGCAEGETVLRPPWPEKLKVFCVLTVREDPFGVTANLLGPLVVNFEECLGRQVILSESGYPVRYPVAGPFNEAETTDTAPEKEKDVEEC